MNTISTLLFGYNSTYDPLKYINDMSESRGGQEVRTPMKYHKTIGFLGNTGSDPLKNHKATKPAFNAGHSLPRQRNISLAGRCWPDLSSIWIHSSTKKTLSKLDPSE